MSSDRPYQRRSETILRRMSQQLDTLLAAGYRGFTDAGGASVEERGWPS
jgi:hypothetical protein